MHANSKHQVVQLGVWTVVVNKTSFFTLEWLPNAGTIAPQLWAIVRSLLLPPAIGESSPKRMSALFLSALVVDLFTICLSFAEEKVEKTAEPGVAIEIRTFSYLLAFMKEIYGLGPIYLFVDLAVKVWYIIEGALQLYFTSKILGLVLLPFTL